MGPEPASKNDHIWHCFRPAETSRTAVQSNLQACRGFPHLLKHQQGPGKEILGLGMLQLILMVNFEVSFWWASWTIPEKILEGPTRKP